ncbi:leucyl/phenylalanyl-tRNA--protein transferase [Geothermobacter ehrlichii]|uniref:Leucyl/phenylalanyl-tRNA--protein transferase n=1 Tax=Geothermobacter ehrlichii TaxID=213224 RepID=A0A5D3WKM3_9BACT|nr:leucyl/phenylalanyl-tRNA--protein transferase [Geothermobacter ehrlichii]TYO97091.1 leucyl/phenylalanyl-tRNA--protein transferase [Geothermobacter ehrlichii]
MPVYRLGDALVFPPPHLAEANGLLAVGGDLASERLLLAYSMGIFPWFNEGDPLLWWSPDPRCVLFPGELHVSRSLAKTLRRGRYRISFDQAFDQVVELCAGLRRRSQEGTWITPQMQEAYGRLHRLGYAHSVEAWHEGELAGGLYGICLGRFFFGESMFSRRRDASKVAFVTLVRSLQAANFLLIDCQLPSPHLHSLGARDLDRERFLHLLDLGGLRVSPRPEPGFFPSEPIASAAV